MIAFGDDRFSQNPMPKDVIPLSEDWLHHAGVSMPSCPSGDVSLQNLPSTLYNAVVYPLAPYAIRGVVSGIRASRMWATLRPMRICCVR